MWDRLLALFKDKPATNEIHSSVPGVEEIGGQAPYKGFNPSDGRSTHIGYNYLKGLDGDYEDSSKHVRRFINLNRLLRGDYGGKIETTHGESQSDLRREDTE